MKRSGFKIKPRKPMRRTAFKVKGGKLRRKSLLPIPTLRRKCDQLIQIIGNANNPKSLISGKPTQVMHHFFPKSVSSFHRYNWANLIPLTNGEHMRLHQAGDPTITEDILHVMGIEWFTELKEHKRDYVKQNRQYYETILEELKKLLPNNAAVIKWKNIQR